MARGDTITEVDLPTEIVPENRPKSGRGSGAGKRDERQRLLNALEDARWHRGKAAELLGVSRRHVYRLMDKHEIE